MQPCVLTVLRSGGEYRVEHVKRLRDQVARHAPGVPFRCIADVDCPGRIEMRGDWPGWWAKIEAFTLPGPILYMDLDTTITGDPGPLLEAAAAHEFIALRDFTGGGGRTVQSSVMAWRGRAVAGMHDRFAADPAGHMAFCTTPRWWGDQGFIELHGPGPAFWQDVAPGAVVSFKMHCQGGVPDGARVVAHHGKPRPWEVEEAA